MAPTPPKEQEQAIEYLPPNRGQKIITGLTLVVLCAVLAYAVMERRSIKQLAASRDELSAELNLEHTQIQTLTQKLLAAQSAPAPAPAAAPQPAVISASEEPSRMTPPTRVQRQVRRHPTVARAHRAEDPWRKRLQSQLDDQQKQIARDQQMIQDTQNSVQQTRTDLESNLESTRDDLNGAIAKNHDEVVALERKGERNYYEFSLTRSKQFQRQGPMGVSLRKSNEKHKYCDLVMIVNDSEVSKKHVNLYEPVLFYPEGYSQPLQLVINNVGKDSVRGYVSEPKYKSTELATARAASSGSAGAGTAGQAAPSASPESTPLPHRPATQE